MSKENSEQPTRGTILPINIRSYDLKPFFQLDLSPLSRSELEAIAVKFPQLGTPQMRADLDDDTLRKYVEIFLGLEKIGNIGVTSRTLETVKFLVPDIIERIISNRSGKIIFLGNGLSLAPLEAIKKIAEKGLDLPKVIIHDLFNYQDLLSKLLTAKKEIQDNNFRVPKELEKDITNCKALVEAEEKGLISFESHAFGYDQTLPPTLLDADLVFNIYGPPRSTIDEQLSLLKEKGSLISVKASPTQVEEYEISNISTKAIETEFFAFVKK